MKIKAKILALAMCFSVMPMSAFALDNLQNATPDGENKVEVSLTVGETWTVKIPKNIVLQAASKGAEYSVEVSGNIAGTKFISVAPDASFLMSQDGKDDITATITQEKQVVASAEIENGSVVTIPGSIAAPEATSGTWNGKFNFNIELEDVHVCTPAADDGDCTTEVLCSVCGGVVVQGQEHAYTDNCDAECDNEGCTQTRVAPHTPAEDDGDCSTATTCNGCGAVITEATAHIPNADDSDCTTAITCSVCGTETTAAQTEHSFTNSGDTSCNNDGCEYEIQTTPFIVTKDNRSKIGYTDSTTNLVIPATFQDTDGTWYKVTEIGRIAFQNCSNLTSIEIPDGVTSIGDYAFFRCGNLTSIEIPDSVTSIGGGAFQDCTSLTSIVIPDSVTSIGGGAFQDCTSLTSIVIQDGVKSIGISAFINCSSLTSIEIPDSITSINVSAFEKCSKLTSITFRGTMEQWNAITKGSGWNDNTGNYTIHCTDGDIPKS